MTGYAAPNAKPGRCRKCGGTGTYSWGGERYGAPLRVGKCFSCNGTGKQTRRQMRRNQTYNQHKDA
jgi:hypothetical protein